MSKFVIVAICLTICSRLLADDSKIIDLEISPQAIELDPLRYQLLPREYELKRGNAAAILLRMPWDRTAYMTEVFPHLHEWANRPLHDPAWDQQDPDGSAKGLPAPMYDAMKRAAYRNQCDWDYPIGETQPPHFILLPDVQGIRGFFYGLSSEAREHIARHDFVKAREVILVGFANARHLSQTPFEIVQQVAMALQLAMLTRTAEMMGEPESPNLYWALTTLPKSMLQLERAADLEASMFTMGLPAIHELERKRDEDEWSRLLAQVFELLESIDSLPKVTFLEGIERQLRFLKLARKDLRRLSNKSADEIKEMSNPETIVRWLILTHSLYDNRVSAVTRLAPSEAWPELKKLDAELKAVANESGLFKESSDSSHWSNPISRFVRLRIVDRRIQQLRIVEAIRDYLASHHGKFPNTLDEITSVPIPVDSLTGKPFEWSINQNQAMLQPPQLPADIVSEAARQSAGQTYRLTIRASKPQ